MEFLKPTRGLSWSPVEPGLVALGWVQPSRSLHEKLCKFRGAGRAQQCPGPARSPHGARCSCSPVVPGARQSLARAREAALLGGWQAWSACVTITVLSALGNAELMFWGFFPFPLGVYISKKWLTVNIRFHLHFWKSQILKFALLPCSCGYKCEHLALWLEGFFLVGARVFRVQLELLFNQCLFSFLFYSLPSMDFPASPVWLAWLSHLWVSTCFVRSVGGNG